MVLCMNSPSSGAHHDHTNTFRIFQVPRAQSSLPLQAPDERAPAPHVSQHDTRSTASSSAALWPSATAVHVGDESAPMAHGSLPRPLRLRPSSAAALQSPDGRVPSRGGGTGQAVVRQLLHGPAHGRAEVQGPESRTAEQPSHAPQSRPWARNRRTASRCTQATRRFPHGGHSQERGRFSVAMIEPPVISKNVHKFL